MEKGLWYFLYRVCVCVEGHIDMYLHLTEMTQVFETPLDDRQGSTYVIWSITVKSSVMNAMASQIAGVPVIYSTVCSRGDQRKHESSASLAFVRGIHRWPVNSPHKGSVTRKKFHLMTSLCRYHGRWWFGILMEVSHDKTRQFLSCYRLTLVTKPMGWRPPARVKMTHCYCYRCSLLFRTMYRMLQI